MKVDRPRGRPRSGEIDARVLEVTRKLLADAGYAALTMEAVARAAGVGKQTLYRRWPRKPLLVFDAVFGGAGAVTASLPDTGSLAADLAAVTAEQARVHTDPATARLLPGLLADCLTDPALMEALRTRFIRPRMRSLAELMDRAARRGEVAPDLPPEFLADLVGGAMLAQAVVYGGDLATFGRHLAHLIARGAGPQPPRPATYQPETHQPATGQRVTRQPATDQTQTDQTEMPESGVPRPDLSRPDLSKSEVHGGATRDPR